MPIAAAAALAVALRAHKLVVLTDVDGVYADWPDRDSLISSLTASQLRGLLPGLQSGMIPKMEACLTAVQGGVKAAHVRWPMPGKSPCTWDANSRIYLCPSWGRPSAAEITQR